MRCVLVSLSVLSLALLGGVQGCSTTGTQCDPSFGDFFGRFRADSAFQESRTPAMVSVRWYRVGSASEVRVMLPSTDRLTKYPAPQVIAEHGLLEVVKVSDDLVNTICVGFPDSQCDVTYDFENDGCTWRLSNVLHFETPPRFQANWEKPPQ